MQSVQKQENEGEGAGAARQESGAGVGGGVGGGGGATAAASADGRAEFRELFVSLIDPSGVLDMGRCGEIARRMEESSGSGYGAGARMARLLAGIFADAADIVDRPVEDGAMYHTASAAREMRAILFDTAKSYRDGGDGEPIGELEKLRKIVAAFRAEADVRRASLRSSGPPGSGLSKYDSLYRGKICKDVIREDIEKIRAGRRAEGIDPIFPPDPGSVDEILDMGEGPRWSSAEMAALERGDGPPEGYKLVRIDDVV